MSSLRALHKSLGQTQRDVTSAVEGNINRLDYIKQVRKIPRLQ